MGVQTGDYAVIAVAKCEKSLSGTWDGIVIYWVEGGKEEEKARIHADPSKTHEITIVYGWDGQVKFSVDGEFIYGFVATADKYAIVSQGAEVDTPEALPTPTSTAPTGEGYQPKSVNEIQQQYIALGLGAGAIATIIIILLIRRR